MRLESKRKIWHLSSGLTYVFLVYLGIIGLLETLVLLLIFTAIVIIYKKWDNKPIDWLFANLERKENLKKSPAGASVYFLIAALVMMVILPKDAFLAVMTILSLGDATAALIGPYGRINYFYNKRKKLEGVMAGIVAAGLGALIFVPWREAFLAAFLAMGLEGLDLKIKSYKIEDNFLIPVVAGVVILLLRIII